MAQPRVAEPVVTTRPAAAARQGGTFAALAVPSYGRLWASGWLWSITCWMAVFLCSYLVNELTHAPLLVQFTGAAVFAPMFFAGALGGVISDRFDRRRAILHQLIVLTPIAIAMSALVLSGAARVWMVYPFMLVVGLGMVIDMTSRRALIYDFVGEERISNALALESLAMTGGEMLGGLLGGAIINFIGIGQAFLAIIVFYAASFLLLRGVPSPARIGASRESTSFLADVVAGFRFLREHRALISLLGVTVIFNVFYFSYSPLVPVFADRLNVNAFWTGVLASAGGLGSMLGSLSIAALAPRRRGRIYVGGSALALTALLLFALAGWYPAALAALLVGGIGTAGVSTMDGTLVMLAAAPEMHGRALGMLSMTIGSLPFAMTVLGMVAQRVGAPAAVAGSAALGLATLLVWNTLRPEARRLA